MPLTERDRKTIKIGGIAAASMLGLVLVLQFLGKGGDTDILVLPSDIPSVAPSGQSPTTGPGGSGTFTSSPTDTPSPAPTANFTGRDPFSIPAIFQTTTSSSGTSSSGTSSSGTSSSGTSTSGTSTSTSGTSPTQPGNGSGTTVGGHEVVLLDVFTLNGVQTIQIEVDGTVYNVSEGDTFGPGNQFELLSVSGDCAALLYGDESFTLCASPQK